MPDPVMKVYILHRLFRISVIAMATVLVTWPALSTGGDDQLLSVASDSPAGQRIADLKTFINDDNVVLFHNEMMEFQGEAFSAGRARMDYVQFIFDLWELDPASHADLNWGNAGKDEFRISVAAVIAIGIRDGWVEFDQEEINRYFRARLTADHPHVSLMAMIYLSVGGNDEDALLFKKLSLSKPESMARQAIKALGRMCRPSGEESLKQLESELRDGERRALVAETLKLYYGDGPASRCR